MNTRIVPLIAAVGVLGSIAAAGTIVSRMRKPAKAEKVRSAGTAKPVQQ